VSARRLDGPGADRIVRNDRPEHYETTIEALGESWMTRTERFFVRNHLPVPRIDADAWRLNVTGWVRTPLALSLDDLATLPRVEAVYTIECAGNGRALFEVQAPGAQWGLGAVGTAAWSGVRLAAVLQRAGVRLEAKHVWFEAADPPQPGVPAFVRSVPIEKAMDDVLLADTMNGEPLPELHGAPLRAVVPGWFGMASTKWLTALRVEDRPSDNHFMARDYHFAYGDADPATSASVETMLVKSLITRPLDGTIVPVDTSAPVVRVDGFAWAGPAGVRTVEVSADGGTTWLRADFVGETSPNAWRAWKAEVPVQPPARITLMARATDNDGRQQPLIARANTAGYGNNSIHKVSIDVRA
jgi:DMSO/TMAO reductase YedYZ molybdopterin-dependent catalytic subunit